jgi:hypothetical protein
MSNPMQTGDGVGLFTKAFSRFRDVVSGKEDAEKKSRQGEFSDAASAHALILKHQEAEHSHISSEAEKNRTHQKDLITHVVTTMSGKPGTLKSDGGKIELYSPAQKPAATRKPKSPVETPALTPTAKTTKTAPKSSAVKKPAVPPTPTKSRKVK